MQPIMHPEENRGHTSGHEEQAPLLNTEGLRNDLGSLRDTELVQQTAEAFNGENFLDLCESIAAACGDAWKRFESHVAAPALRNTVDWLSEALSNWPTESAELVTQRNQAEARARGELKDTLDRIARERVRIEAGEQETPVETMPEPTKPEFKQPVLNTELSEEEKEERALTTALRENRIHAVGDPKKPLANIPNPSEKLAFWVAALATLFMGYLEFLMGFDVTGAKLSRAGSFAVSLCITVGTNILAAFGIERLHHVLSYWGAKSNYAQYLNRTRKEDKKPMATTPESPGMMTWLIGVGGTLILIVCLILLVIYRQDVIREDSYLKGSEIAVYALCVSVIITMIVHLRFTSPFAKHFFEREGQLLDELKPVQKQAKAKKAERELQNQQAQAAAQEEHEKLMEEYELAMRLYNTDPVEAAIEVYRAAVHEAETPISELVGDINSQIAHRAALTDEYHQARRRVLLAGYGELIEDLADAVSNVAEDRGYNFEPNDWFKTEQAKAITQLALAACPFDLTHTNLDKLIKQFAPSAIPPLALLTEIEPILTASSTDERVKVVQRRSEAEVARIKEQTAQKMAEQELAASKLRRVSRYIPVEEE